MIPLSLNINFISLLFNDDNFSFLAKMNLLSSHCQIPNKKTTKSKCVVFPMPSFFLFLFTWLVLFRVLSILFYTQCAERMDPTYLTYRTKFRRTKFFGGQNFRHQVEISAVLSNEIFSVSYFPIQFTRKYVLNILRPINDQEEAQEKLPSSSRAVTASSVEIEELATSRSAFASIVGNISSRTAMSIPSSTAKMKKWAKIKWGEIWWDSWERKFSVHSQDPIIFSVAFTVLEI